VSKGFMVRTPVTSSLFKQIGYDGEGKLELLFNNGKTWTYIGVPPSIHTQLMNAESMGNFYHFNIKGKYLTSSERNQALINMADKIIKMKIDVSKIDKSRLFKGEKGVYLDCTLLYNETADQYGNNGMIVQDVPKAEYEKDKTLKGAILGNGKVFGAPAPAAKPGEESGTQLNGGAGAEVPDDLPF